MSKNNINCNLVGIDGGEDINIASVINQSQLQNVLDGSESSNQDSNITASNNKDINTTDSNFNCDNTKQTTIDITQNNLNNDCDNFDSQSFTQENKETTNNHDLDSSQKQESHENINQENDIQNDNTYNQDNQTTTQVEQVQNETDKIFMSQSWQEKVDSFMQSFPKSQQYVSLIGQEIINDLSLQSNENCLEIAYARVMNNLYTPPCEIINDQDFREKYVFNNKEITSKIIENYLINLESNKPPKSILTRGQIVLTPPDKPRSIEEAGKVIKNMLHNRRI